MLNSVEMSVSPKFNLFPPSSFWDFEGIVLELRKQTAHATHVIVVFSAIKVADVPDGNVGRNRWRGYFQKCSTDTPRDTAAHSLWPQATDVSPAHQPRSCWGSRPLAHPSSSSVHGSEHRDWMPRSLLRCESLQRAKKRTRVSQSSPSQLSVPWLTSKDNILWERGYRNHTRHYKSPWVL